MFVPHAPWIERLETDGFNKAKVSGRFQGLREVQVIRVQTVGAQSTGLVTDGNHLGGSRGGSSKQMGMASECTLMHPYPNASTWMRAESRSRSTLVVDSCHDFLIVPFIIVLVVISVVFIV